MPGVSAHLRRSRDGSRGRLLASDRLESSKDLHQDLEILADAIASSCEQKAGLLPSYGQARARLMCRILWSTPLSIAFLRNPFVLAMYTRA